MSDYLGHLVSRALFPAAGVQPRLPSVFEPSMESHTAGAEPDVTTVTIAPSVQPRALRQAALPDADVAAPDRAVTRAVDAPVRAPSNEGSADPVESPGESTSGRPVPLADRREPASAARRRLSGRPPIARTDEEVVVPAHPADARPLVSFGRVSSEPSPPAHVESRELATHEPVSVLAPMASPRGELELRAARPRVTPTHATSARTTRAHATDSRSEEAAERSVHVTIGRVEIRAASAPVATRSPAAASAAMSLGEYLRQRRTPGAP